ncbi:type II toxin-antitoxin system RelE/ParE family toxin [Sulfuricurvum sp.]|uniref:type II toxin-antitoxin system RelE/ParE family toxin n=1 Tax=Sulfuricurvum sp. TaxID=2025608 RepID=UPI001996B34F|nr:type II toxin-antitoxin system RelE/ParE family toxin [Sulfuricurvum sp.]MBD3799766.1 type II toxin-antitoxin system RelE/ParE family toxin [Campylobacterota bacterium]MBD3805849.1 type II toxin-antitoxin system RelE/ParE family toxin [Sulfuricurvum sp.]
MDKKIYVVFYQAPSGNEPVREWLKSLSAEDRQNIGNDIKTVEYGWPIGMPVARPLGNKLYEVRSSISDKRIARVIFTIIDHYMVLLNGFVKKTQQTPKEEIDLALKRMKEIQ